jgi:hypothetical protein
MNNKQTASLVTPRCMPDSSPKSTFYPAVSRAVDLARNASADPSAWEHGDENAPLSNASRAGRVVAIGDPQAPFERFLQILWQHGLLAETGRLEEDVHLVSMGDHFDFGAFDERESAAQSGELLLSWLAAHLPHQVTLLTGNHDLSRVGELAAFSAVEFDAASRMARELYRLDPPDAEREASFFARFPALPSIELAARDLSTFRPEQRTMVRALLERGRFRLAAEFSGALLCHAGITSEHLTAIGIPKDAHSDARRVSEALNASLQRAVKLWEQNPTSPLEIPHLHRSGSHATGEGGGILFHRPARPSNAHPDDGAPDLFSRRYDPRRIPRGMIQITGHVRDAKSRSLLGAWALDDAGADGQLRSLTIRGDQVEYRKGVPKPEPGLTAMLFTDGAMAQTPPARYQVLDLNTLQPLNVRDASG